MFSINREAQPIELNNIDIKFKDEINGLNIKAAYKHYKDNKHRLKYNTEETKKLFEKMNFRRCTFCGQAIDDFNKAMTIEHIKLKSKYPKKIYEWNNLLCSCKTCNTIRSTKKCYDNLYLDPTKITCIEKYFKFELDGQIKPNYGLDNDDVDRAEYMIELYKLNREDIVYDRRDFFRDLLDDQIFDWLNKHDKYNKHIIFLGLFTYYKKEVNK